MADQMPPSVSGPVRRTPPVAIWSLILAILSFTCGWLFTAIPAVICGHIARSKIQKSGGALPGKGIANAGLALGYLALIIGVVSIPLLVSMIKSERERTQRVTTELKGIISADGNIKINIPTSWTELPELNSQAKLQAGDKSKEVYLIVIGQPKAEVADSSLEKQHQLTRDQILQKMQNASGGTPVSLTINGHPALQDELSGTEHGTDIVYLHTSVEGRDQFHQILAWTPKSRWKQQNALLREVTKSFRSRQ